MKIIRTLLALPQEIREKACKIAIYVTGKPSIVGGVVIAIKAYKIKKG